jgi:hypothetical protein
VDEERIEMNEWKEFLLTGEDYDWETKILNNGLLIKYREKPEPKQPTHEEIMTKWWKQSANWVKVNKYDPSIATKNVYQISSGHYHSKDWFTGRESADIPPEAE